VESSIRVPYSGAESRSRRPADRIASGSCLRCRTTVLSPSALVRNLLCATYPSYIFQGVRMENTNGVINRETKFEDLPERRIGRIIFIPKAALKEVPVG